MTGKQKPAIERFIDKIEISPETGCWAWTASLNAAGYALLNINNRSKLAHRFSYEYHVGAIPDGLHLDHTCHTNAADCPGGITCPHRSCVNPDHLEPVTQRENNSRSKLGISTINAAKTHCKHGHEFTEANTYITKRGTRQCKRCCADVMRALYARRRGAA